MTGAAERSPFPLVFTAATHDTRDLFGVPGNPTDPTRTGLFLTRWITHLCAPTFFLLTGTGAFLSRNRWPERSLTCLVIYGSAHWMTQSPSLDRCPFTPPPGWGFALPVVYLVWIAVVVVLYPACRRFAQVKARRGGILRYF